MGATLANVRALTGITSTEISDADMNIIIAAVDSFMDDRLGGNSAYHWESFDQNLMEDRFLQLTTTDTVSSINRVFVDGLELFRDSKDNILRNPDLVQEDSTTTTIPQYWAKGSETSATLTWDSTAAYTNRKSISILKTASSTAYWDAEDVSVVEGDPYTLSFYVKTTSVTAGSGSGAYVSIVWKDSSDATLATDTSSATTGTADFTKVTLRKYAPALAVSAEIRANHDGAAGTAYFDNFSFSKTQWTPHTTDKIVEFTDEKPCRHIDVQMVLSADSGAVSDISDYMAARNALLRAVGGTATGLSYTVNQVKIDRGSLSKSRLDLIEAYDKIIQEEWENIASDNDPDPGADDIGVVDNVDNYQIMPGYYFNSGNQRDTLRNRY